MGVKCLITGGPNAGIPTAHDPKCWLWDSPFKSNDFNLRAEILMKEVNSVISSSLQRSVSNIHKAKY